MPYNTNPDLVDARAELVAPLREGRSAAWQALDRRDARRLADRIRETLYIARLYPERFPELAAAAEKYSIYVVPPSRVEAKPRVRARTETPAFATGSRAGPSEQGLDATQHGLAAHGRVVPTVGLSTAAQVMASWLDRGPSNDPLYLVETSLSVAELTVLHKWAQSRPRKLMLLVTPETLTLSLWDDEVGPYSWQPPAVPTPPEVFPL